MEILFFTVYFETGSTGTTAGTLSIATGTGPGQRTWKIKVTYLECTNIAKYVQIAYF